VADNVGVLHWLAYKISSMLSASQMSATPSGLPHSHSVINGAVKKSRESFERLFRLASTTITGAVPLSRTQAVHSGHCAFMLSVQKL
jgi:hypothetical protein